MSSLSKIILITTLSLPFLHIPSVATWDYLPNQWALPTYDFTKIPSSYTLIQTAENLKNIHQQTTQSLQIFLNKHPNLPALNNFQSQLQKNITDFNTTYKYIESCKHAYLLGSDFDKNPDKLPSPINSKLTLPDQKNPKKIIGEKIHQLSILHLELKKLSEKAYASHH